MTKQNKPIGKYRYRILALLFMATTINYMDRSVIGVLGPTLRDTVFHWTNEDYSIIMVFFKMAYAMGMLTMGGVIDKWGTKIGYTLAIAIWSVFGMLHAVISPAFSVIGFAAARFGLGFGEAGNFPAAIKTTAEWFPKKDRAFATGIFNAGSNVGAIMAPLIIPLVVDAETGHNWQWGFLVTGIFSAIWVVLWLKTYRKPEEHPKLTKEELDYINSDNVNESTEKLPWASVLPLKQTWAFAIGKLTDAVWWFYLFWAAFFLYDKFGLKLDDIALPLIVIYVVADIGSIGGGWLSRFFMGQGWSLNKARKITLLVCAMLILPVMFATKVDSGFKITNETFQSLNEEGLDADYYNILKPLEDKEFTYAKDFEKEIRSLYVGNGYNVRLDDNGNEIVDSNNNASYSENDQFAVLKSNVLHYSRTSHSYWIAVLLIALAAAGHQAWSANLFTVASDVMPKKATASVVGIGGMVGALAGMVADFSLGQVLDSASENGYFWAFFGAGIMYLVVLGIIHLMLPKMKPLGEDLKPITDN